MPQDSVLCQRYEMTGLLVEHQYKGRETVDFHYLSLRFFHYHLNNMILFWIRIFVSPKVVAGNTSTQLYDVYIP